jgi:hypothetical protein
VQLSRLAPTALICGLLAVGAAAPAAAAPTCTSAGSEALCGGRVVAEPSGSTTFVQYGLEFTEVLGALEGLAPDVVEARPLHEWTGDATHRSAGGRDLWVVRVTDESVPDDAKRHVVTSLSIHGNESAGREGGIRYLEDVVRWRAQDPDRLLYTGGHGLPLSRVLRETVLWLGFTNPDGWAQGDVADPEWVTFDRANSNGADLNREFPTTGWTKRASTQLSEPEAIGWVEFVSALPNVTTATDIHGELTSATDSFADMMWPAGQWTPTRQAQELQLAENMTATIERKFADYGVVLDDLFGLFGSGTGLGTKPAQYATAYDIVGYDDSGFMGDWLAAQDAVEIDVENFLSHLVPGNVWFAPLEEAHVAAVRGILESIWIEALVTDQVRPDLDLGRVAYVDDPDPVSSTDDDGFGFELLEGEDPEHYEVSRLRYFADLAADAGTPITALTPSRVAAGGLGAHDTVVVADVPFPRDPDGAAVDRRAYVAALDEFVTAGGQLLLTDGAVELLVDLGIVTSEDLRFGGAEAGHVDFGERDHPWEADLAGLPSQTYYEVPLGYRSGSGEPEAPHHGVDPAAWEAAGGTTVGTSLGFTTLGELPRGAGRIAVFGAILPTQTEANPHLYGLADYAVTVNGGAVLHAILAYRSPQEGAPDPTDPPTGSPAPAAPAAPLPTTGGGALALGILALGGAARLRRARGSA